MKHNEREKEIEKKGMPRVRLELTAFRLWDWRAAYCATEAGEGPGKEISQVGVFSLFLQNARKRKIQGWKNKKKIDMRRPGIEPGSTAWKAAMLTTIPPTLSWETGTEDWKKIEWKRSTDTIRMGKDVRILSFQVDVISFKWKNWQGNEMGKSHCRDQDSNLGYCGHNAGS